MARTKQTAYRTTGGKAPRKQLASEIGKKRKTPENDECDGNARKRMKFMKLHSNHDTSKYEDDYQEEENQDNVEDNADTQIKMNHVLQSVRSIFGSNCSQSQLLTFAKKLETVNTKNKKKLEELKYRKNAIISFCNHYQKRMNYTYSNDRYFNKQILHFFKTSVKAFRFRTIKNHEEWDYYATHYTDYSLDIALASKPHKNYTKIMHDLLREYVDIADISKIISEYSHNGYRWYRLKVTEQTDEDCEYWQQYTDSIFYNVKFDPDDYFRNDKYYKKRSAYGSSTGRAVSFSELREEMKYKCITNMSNEDLSCFIVAVGMIELDATLLEDCEDWIMQYHK